MKSSVAAASVGTLASALEAPAAESGAGTAGPAREYYELRRYLLRRGPKQKLFDDFYRQAAIPALNRAGVRAVGVFGMMYGPDSPGMYVLLPHASLEAYAATRQKLDDDAEYQKAGAEFLNAPATDPAYIRVESSLMRAFAGIPQLEIPAAAQGNHARIFELRTYENHSFKANQKKIEMFNVGEIAIFRRAGLQPVFFGETIIGAKLPNLTYLLTFENMAAHDKCWGAFGGDPEWRKLSSTPGYTDPEIVTNISNIFLRPAAYSQI